MPGIGAIYRCRLLAQVGLRRNYYFFHMRARSISSTNDNLHPIFTQASSQFMSRLALMTSSQVKFVSVSIMDLSIFQPFPDVYPCASSLAGAQLAPPIPLNNTVHIRWRTPRRDRNGTGHTWIFGIGANRLVNGLWTTSMLGNINSYISYVVGTFGENGTNTFWQMGVLSRKIAGAIRPINPAGFQPYRSGHYNPFPHPNSKRLVDRTIPAAWNDFIFYP